MSIFARIFQRLWVIVLICACGYLVWSNQGRVRRVDYVSGLEGRARRADVLDAGSPTGYADGQRELIIPEANEDSFHWIAQTQQMFARGEPRVRHVDYENAPAGRDVTAASPYRWWLGLVAVVGHEATGRPMGVSVEWAALYSDPILHLILLLGAGVLAARRLGGLAAALLSAGLAAMFPFASGFLPGMPDQHGLANALALGSILVLVAGLGAPGSGAGPGAPSRRADRWFALAGIIGGLGMWVSVSTQVPVTAGIMLGAFTASWVSRGDLPGNPPGERVPAPWRVWAVSGGATVLAAYAAEYFPGHMGSLRMESVHPLYGLAWIGGGELLERAGSWIRGEKPARGWREVAAIVLSCAAVASLPVVYWVTRDPTFLAKDSIWAHLTLLPNGAVAANSWAWLRRDGASPAAWATLLPLIAVPPAAWLVLRPAAGPLLRARLSVALGPVLVALGFASQRLSWWGVFDGALLVLVAAGASGEGKLGRLPARWIWAATVIGSAILGVAQLSPKGAIGQEMTLTSRESEQLIERHLAHWLEKRTGEEGIVVFAPPSETTALCFFGGLRGIGSFAADNRAGFGATLAIAAASTMEEAQGGLQGHGARYVVIPSWDPFFEEFAHLYLAEKFSGRSSLLVTALRRWNLPPWLRPVPYQMPVGGGFEGQSVLVFEVVDEQSPATAAGRLAEYFIETGNLRNASVAAEALKKFPGDVGALAARAQVQSALGDAAASAKTMDVLLSRLSNGGDRYLPWDRRISLATVLVRGGQIGLARDQMRRCMGDLNEGRLRSLSTASLYDLLVLAHAFGLEITDPRIRDLAVDLLPDNLRGSL
jgi:hypothetical protein